MIFHDKDIYAKVWKIQKATGKYIDLQVSTSKKDKSGNYVNSTWFPRCVGHAFNKLNGVLKEGDKIVIHQCALSNEKYTAQDGATKSKFQFLILDADVAAANEASPTEKAKEPSGTETANTGDSECPW